MLIDEVVITIKAGRGGDGAVSFRREKYVPKGGPDGGDGGNGGNIYLSASHSTHGLDQFRGQKDYSALDGDRGGRNKRHGADGKDFILSVPPGTKVTELTYEGKEQLVSDIVQEIEPMLIARGGRGGAGNWHFRSATNQTPREFVPGKPGQTLTLKLELQLIADVGLVGLPNAGKSTFLSKISNARPKIADYPFTTLQPVLGMVAHHERTLVVADLPGLIEGAAEGKGLGHEFLKHIQRTRVLVHFIAIIEDDLETAYQTIRAELKQFDPNLTEKPEIVVLTKIDLDLDWQKTHKAFIKKHQALGVSAATNIGIDALLARIVPLLD